MAHVGLSWILRSSYSTIFNL